MRTGSGYRPYSRQAGHNLRLTMWAGELLRNKVGVSTHNRITAKLLLPYRTIHVDSLGQAELVKPFSKGEISENPDKLANDNGSAAELLNRQ